MSLAIMHVFDSMCVILSVCLSVCLFVLTIKPTRRMAIANWTCVSWVAYATGTIAVNVTWIKREFNACQTPRSMYPSIFNHFWDIVVYRWRVSGFQQYTRERMSVFNHILLSPGYAPVTIAINVTWINREFNACQTHCSIYTSIFNRLRAIARYWSEIATFSYPPCI